MVLAAGASRRFGDDNKLLTEFEGTPLIVRVLDAVAEAGVTEVVVVTGWDGEAVEVALDGRDVRLVHNPDWDSGMGGSIGVGVAALDPAIAGAMIVPGDVPLLSGSVVSRLIEAFAQTGESCVVYPTTATGEQRNPVLWPRRFFDDLQSLPVGEGAKSLLKSLPDSACRPIAVDNDVAFLDIDTQAGLEAARGLKRSD